MAGRFARRSIACWRASSLRKTEGHAPIEHGPEEASEVQAVWTYHPADCLSGRAEPDEYVQIKNFDDKPIQLKDWTLRDQADNVFTFPSFLMEPGQVCQVYTNRWNASACNFNFESRQAIWDNTGDCAFLRDAAGAEVFTYCY